MIASSFTAHDVALAAGWLAAGAATGAVFFLSLHWNVRMLAGGSPLLLVMALQLARFAVIGATLAAIAIHFGALALLAAAAGIVATRAAVIRLGSMHP
jgi:F1F0 ATPase subunit 2